MYITLIFAYKPFNSPFLMKGEGEVNKKHSAYVQLRSRIISSFRFISQREYKRKIRREAPKSNKFSTLGTSLKCFFIEALSHYILCNFYCYTLSYNKKKLIPCSRNAPSLKCEELLFALNCVL